MMGTSVQNIRMYTVKVVHAETLLVFFKKTTLLWHVWAKYIFCKYISFQTPSVALPDDRSDWLNAKLVKVVCINGRYKCDYGTLEMKSPYLKLHCFEYVANYTVDLSAITIFGEVLYLRLGGAM